MTDQITTSLAEAKVLVMHGMRGEDGEPGPGGISPTVSFEQITVDGRTGNRMTVTDAEHPSGQSINILNGKDGEGSGESVTVDDALSDTSENPVQNKVIKEALDGKGTYSKPTGGIPKSDLSADVQTSLGKADTALQQHQSLAGYATEAWVGQQIANIPDELPSGGSAGDFLRRTSSGAAWQTVPSAESNSFGGGA